MAEIKELLGPWNAKLFKQDVVSPIFCKPKLIPLKTVTMEKLEKMQQEVIDKMQELAMKEQIGSKEEIPPEDPAPSESTNIWKADD